MRFFICIISFIPGNKLMRSSFNDEENEAQKGEARSEQIIKQELFHSQCCHAFHCNGYGILLFSLCETENNSENNKDGSEG